MNNNVTKFPPLEEIQEEFSEYFIDAPEPLQRSIAAGKAYPLDKLGTGKDSRLSLAAQELVNTVQCADGIAAHSILAAAALACQAHRNIEMDGRKKPISLFLLTVGESGERKSAADSVSLRMHRAYEVGLSKASEEALHQFKIDHQSWKKTQTDVLRNNKTQEDRKKELAKLGKEPEPPLSPNILIEEPTYEGLVKLLHEGQPSVGLFSDEGGRFIGGHGMSTDNALKTASGISKLFDDGTATRVRAGDGALLLRGKRISMHLMMQGVVAEQVYSNRILSEQGLLARCCVVWSESRIGSRKYQSVDINKADDIVAYNNRIRELLQKEKPLADEMRNTLNPSSLRLTPEAKELWIKYHDELDKEAAAEGKLEAVRALAIKMPDHVLRIAGVFTVFEDDKADFIQARTVANAMHLGNFYLEEALRIHGLSATDEDLVAAQKVLDWLQEKEKHTFYLAMIYQNSPIKKLRSKEAATNIIAILEDHNWVTPLPDGAEIDGRKRRKAWAVVPRNKSSA